MISWIYFSAVPFCCERPEADVSCFAPISSSNSSSPYFRYSPPPWSDLMTSVTLFSSRFVMYLNLSTVSVIDLSESENNQFVCLQTTTFTIDFPPFVCTGCLAVLSQWRCDSNFMFSLLMDVLWLHRLGFQSPQVSHFVEIVDHQPRGWRPSRDACFTKKLSHFVWWCMHVPNCDEVSLFSLVWSG